MSSERKDDSPIYTGSSSASWHLVPATKAAPNIISVQSSPILILGGGRINVRGVFQAEATSNRPAHCTLTAPTGSTKYPAVAPGAFNVTIAPDQKAPARAVVVLGPGRNFSATLGNPYFGSECGTSITGEPDANVMDLKSIPRSAFRQKLLVIRFVGATNSNGISYRWSTVFTLKRISFKSG
jgi:hypothetical protein